jgi:hypothetical protein
MNIYTVTRASQTNTVRGANVTDIARKCFGADVTTRYEGHGVHAVTRDLGDGCTGVVGRITPIGR